MPKLRLLGATKMPRLDEYTARPETSISPAVGRSRPAIERKVVVLPQPEGPSSVNSLPSGTWNETSCAAFTTVPLSLAYSVYSDLTFSKAALYNFALAAHATIAFWSRSANLLRSSPRKRGPSAKRSNVSKSGSPPPRGRTERNLPASHPLALRNSESLAQKLGDHDQAEQENDQHDAERRELDILPVLPQLPDHDRHHLGARAVEQDRARQLADRDDQHIDPAGEQAGLEQRQHHAPERHRPGGAAHGGGFLELLVDLQHRG